jgi:hypothetical protein
MYHELETRINVGGECISLVWDDESGEVELHVEAPFSPMQRVRVARERALDALRHPFLYVPPLQAPAVAT